MSFQSNVVRGFKKLDPILRKAVSKLTKEEMWERILGIEFEQAYCPDCETQLEITSCSLELKLNNTLSTQNTWNWRVFKPQIVLELVCPKCGTKVSGIASNMHYQDGVGFESLVVTSIEKGEILNGRD